MVKDGAEYRIYKNEGFLIKPDEVNYYRADDNDPWTYVWIGFNGAESENLLQHSEIGSISPVFHCDECRWIFEKIENSAYIEQGRELYLLSLLYAFFSETSKHSIVTDSSYAAKARDMIKVNLDKDIKVSDISQTLGLDRRYFCSLFKEKYGISPQSFIIKEKINRAMALLESTGISVGEVARSVGYTDQFAFSKIFKKYAGTSPINYRRKKL